MDCASFVFGLSVVFLPEKLTRSVIAPLSAKKSRVCQLSACKRALLTQTSALPTFAVCRLRRRGICIFKPLQIKYHLLIKEILSAGGFC
jgi:hypothetical protein